MTSNITTEDRVAVTAVTRLLLEGSVLIAFKYDGGFTVDFQHEIGRSERGLPIQVSLVLRGRWWPGPEAGIPPKFSTSPGETLCKPEQPYQAFKLMSFVGQAVEHVEIASDGALMVTLTGGNALQVPGREDEWEFSWYLFARSDFPGADAWSVNCAADGELSGSWPTGTHLPTPK
jgi:hypothetical protein